MEKVIQLANLPPCRVVRSRRKTLSLELTPQGPLVRAPLRVPEAEIRRFVESHRSWLEKHLAKQEERLSAGEPPLTEQEIQELAQRAVRELPPRVAHFAGLLGVTYGRITIRCQKTKWGSCSSQGNLNFNCLLMLAPPEVADSIVVHELCHRLEMNHSPAFYAHVRRVFPEYDRCHQWLKENGARLMSRVLRD